MVLHKQSDWKSGMNMIVSDAKDKKSMRLDFGIISLKDGEIWENDAPLERALLLIKGKVRIEWVKDFREAERWNCLDEKPVALQLPAGLMVKVTALNSGKSDGGAELIYEACINDEKFDPVYYDKENIRNDVFGANGMAGTSVRTVRTVFDGEIAKFSNMVMGEVINHPGKWSSYPPHDHPHPEIYHYRLFPEQGMGVSLLENDAHIVRSGSTSCIEPNKTHSQTAAPGYAMYYVWMIPHLPGNRWLPTTRFFREEHKWLLDDNAKIWSDTSA